MPTRQLTAFIALAAVIAGAAGCGGSSDDGAEASSKLTIYSSVPLQGAARGQSESIVNGIKLALEQVDHRVGDFRLEYVSLDDATAQAANWTPEQTSANARRAVQDESTIAYLGEFNSGATVISLPILNEAGVPQVSMANTAVGLTTTGPGSGAGEPDKYYPSGTRTFVRIVPNDAVQGAALATLMNEEGCRRIAVIDDNEVYGKGFADAVSLEAKELGMEVGTRAGIEKNAANYRALADSVVSGGMDCAVYTGLTANGGVPLFKDLASSSPSLKLFGGSGIAESSFADPEQGGVPANVGHRVLIGFESPPPEEFPESGQRFYRDYEEAYGQAPELYGIYGYEAASLVLDAIRRAGERGNDRAAVLEQLFATRDHQGVIGTYDINENGDTTLARYSVFRIRGGELVFERIVEPEL
jgi:branched-chain amino acid transport system substrate-binding protein